MSSDLNRILKLLRQPLPQDRTGYFLGASASNDLALFPASSATQSPGTQLPRGDPPPAQVSSGGDPQGLAWWRLHVFPHPHLGLSGHPAQGLCGLRADVTSAVLPYGLSHNRQPGQVGAEPRR